MVSHFWITWSANVYEYPLASQFRWPYKRCPVVNYQIILRMSRPKFTVWKKSCGERLLLLQGMNCKKPTWNNLRYFYRNVHFSQIIRDGVCIQAVVQGLNDLHKLINRLLEIPESIYGHLRDGWWQFKAT